MQGLSSILFAQEWQNAKAVLYTRISYAIGLHKFGFAVHFNEVLVAVVVSLVLLYPAGICILTALFFSLQLSGITPSLMD